MSVVEIRCPNCGSHSIKNQGNEYVCEYDVDWLIDRLAIKPAKPRLHLPFAFLPCYMRETCSAGQVGAKRHTVAHGLALLGMLLHTPAKAVASHPRMP